MWAANPQSRIREILAFSNVPKLNNNGQLTFSFSMKHRTTCQLFQTSCLACRLQLKLTEQSRAPWTLTILEIFGTCNAIQQAVSNITILLSCECVHRVTSQFFTFITIVLYLLHCLLQLWKQGNLNPNNDPHFVFYPLMLEFTAGWINFFALPSCKCFTPLISFPIHGSHPKIPHNIVLKVPVEMKPSTIIGMRALTYNSFHSSGKNFSWNY